MGRAYSPSIVWEDDTQEGQERDENMDWSDNLDGVGELYANLLPPAVGDGEQQHVEVEAKSTPDADTEDAAAAPAAGGGNVSLEPATARPTDQVPVGQPLEGSAGSSRSEDSTGGAAPPNGGGESSEGDIVERARNFINKQKEEAIAKIKEGLGEKLLGYEAVLETRRRDLTTKHLLGGQPEPTPDVGSMVSTGDMRLLAVKMEVSMGQRRVVTTSFDPVAMTCYCSGPHSQYKIAGGSGVRTGREAIMLTDQAYPACLEATGVRRCVKMVRIEHGMLLELADELISMLRGRYLAAGSIILLFSATNLALAGTSGYCADLMAATEKLKSTIGEHVVYTPLPHFFGPGCGDQMTIRAAVEVGAWALHFFGHDSNVLRDSFGVANDIMEEAGTGGHQVEVASRHRLPAIGRTYTTWYTSGLITLPVAVKPATKEREQLLMTKIIGEIRKGLAIDLEPTPSFERGVGPVMAPPSNGKILVLGSSNGRRLKAALQEAGMEADLMYEPRLVISRGTVEELATALAKNIKKSRPEAIVLQVLDNSVYKALTEEGVKIQHSYQGDGVHYDGDLALCDRHELAKLLKLLKPLLEAADGIKAVVVGPLPKYVTASCCDDPKHMQNRKDTAFLPNLLGELVAINKGIKDFLFMEGFRNMRVMDPWVGLRRLDVNDVWGDDPVHIRRCHYKHLAEGVKLTLDKIKGKKRTGSQQDSATKRGRADSSSSSGGASTNSGQRRMGREGGQRSDRR
jgi:hypothetical protein